MTQDKKKFSTILRKKTTDLNTLRFHKKNPDIKTEMTTGNIKIARISGETLCEKEIMQYFDDSHIHQKTNQSI